ncbi:MAG: nitrite/sulfite reductase [Alphaproteobacteria bacterium]|nr:nitrite/sulfite reductase [Alphaproteobacteria bacterium]MDG2466029.1 nitrite/sulfite reductase [Alphaproteobacteria bacterium]
MYQYSPFDHDYIRQRVRIFREQVDRRIAGVLTEDEFKPLRLQNGVYLQLHAYMLRVAIPYGTLNSRQMRQLAMIADKWDRGYGHFTTRQNIQFNWTKLKDVGDILDALADVEMHAIQTSGNCIRNVTADHFAGAAKDEIEDPRITAELLRQWSTGHPEFAFLPRKFKIAVTGADHDRAVTAFHDIGIGIVKNANGATGYKVIIGGGLGRTPIIGSVLQEFLPKADLLPYLESVLHIYNRYGRRDNKYKARIKILVQELGIDQTRAEIDAHFESIKDRFQDVPEHIMARINAGFAPPDFAQAAAYDLHHDLTVSPAFAAWAENSVMAHRDDRHVMISISLKTPGDTPGDASADQMRVMADLAERFAYDEIRISHEQNVILPHVPKQHVAELYRGLQAAGLASANIGQISDIIACPGMDYCALATARSVPIAQDIARRFGDIKTERQIGPLKIKISGCINACGHHHVGHIGILGLDRAGVENYQITLGGDGTEDAAIGDRTGPGFAADALLPAIETILDTYVEHRLNADEHFLACYRRIGLTPFKKALYPSKQKTAA